MSKSHAQTRPKQEIITSLIASTGRRFTAATLHRQYNCVCKYQSDGVNMTIKGKTTDPVYNMTIKSKTTDPAYNMTEVKTLTKPTT